MSWRDRREGASPRLIVVMLTVGVMAWFGGYSAPAWLVFGAPVAVYAAIWAYIGIQHGRRRWFVRRYVRYLRRLDPNTQREALDHVKHDADRAYLTRALARHGAPESEGAVVRFAFSPIDRRENTMLYWSTLAAGVLLLTAAMSVLSGARWRYASLVVAAILVPVLLLLRRRDQRLQSVLEVSPFGLTEIQPNGARRWVTWQQRLELQNRPWRRRFELRPIGQRDMIAIQYARPGVDHAITLILQYGGFVPNDTESST